MDYIPIIKRMGATVRYKGYPYLLTALDMMQEDPTLIQSLTKILYCRIGCLYSTSSSDVERCIRNLIEHMWKTNEPLMHRLAGYPLYKRPTNSEFFAVMLMLQSEQNDILQEDKMFQDLSILSRYHHNGYPVKSSD